MTEQTASKVPQIRFKGFDGEWVCRKLRDLTETGFTNGVFNDPNKVGRGYRLINVKDMFSGSSIDVDNLSLVDLDENEFKKNRVQYGDIFFTRSSLVKEGIACSNVNLSAHRDITFDGHLIRMQPCREITDSVFLSYAFKTTSSRRQFILGGKTTTMTTIGQSDIAVVEVALPTKIEQTQIGEYFRELDSLIGLHQRKHDKLVTLKKAMLQKMFPQPGATTPEIRFKGFSGDWVEKEFKLIASRSSQFCSENDLPRIEYEDIVSGTGHLNKNLFKKISQKTGIRFEKGDVLFGKLRPYLRNWWLAEFDGIAVGDFWVLTSAAATPCFLYRLIQTEAFERIANQSAGSKMPRSDWKLVSNSLFRTPSDPAEQQKIGTYFRTLDSLISKHATQLQKLQQLKSACLEKMFV